MPADVRAAWSEAGLAFPRSSCKGNSRPLGAAEARPEDSDGVLFWIDTRDVHNVHRATRFCHAFLFLPTGGSKGLTDPVAQWVSITRAREQPRPVEANQLRVLSRRTADGYVLEAFIAAAALTGFDPQEHPRLGFNYQVTDRELSEQTLGVGRPMPYHEDPSLWATLELVRRVE